MTEVFEIAETSKNSGIFMVAVSAFIALLTIGIFGYIGMTMNHMYVEAGPDKVKFRIPMYSRTINRSDIVQDRIKVLNLNQAGSPRLGMRTNGIGLPGFQGGWFRLKGGGKVLTAITDRTKVVLIPTTLGYDVMVSAKAPEALVASLKLPSYR